MEVTLDTTCLAAELSETIATIEDVVDVVGEKRVHLDTICAPIEVGLATNRTESIIVVETICSAPQLSKTSAPIEAVAEAVREKTVNLDTICAPELLKLSIKAVCDTVVAESSGLTPIRTDSIICENIALEGEKDLIETFDLDTICFDPELPFERQYEQLVGSKWSKDMWVINKPIYVNADSMEQVSGAANGIYNLSFIVVVKY